MLNTIINFANLDSIKVTDNQDYNFDIDKYSASVENAKRNKMIERAQAVLLSIPCIMFASLLFIDYRMWEVTALFFIPFIGIFVLEQFKDKEAQKAYDEYADWEAELNELNED